MRGILGIALLFLVITVVVHGTNFALSSCNLSCNEEGYQIIWPPGESCICPDHEALAMRVDAMEAQIRILKGRVRHAPTGWTRASNELFYKYFPETVNYETAKFRCASFGGRLAATGMRTAELRSEIRPLLPNPLPNWPHTWIGLDDLAIEGNYVWSDGEESTEANTDWGPGEPNSSIERCVAMFGNYNGQVIDAPCGDNYYYICEF